MKNLESLAEEKISKLIIKYSIPAILSMLITSLYNIVDRVFIGSINGVGALAIAEFDNPAGLMATEDSLFTVTSNSGLPIMSAGGESNTSNVLAGYLEGSNVDVSEELTDMIKTQRAYQMSTKVVTTSDEMITDLMSIKR